MSKANLTIAHPSSDGSGSALRVSIHYQTDEREGFVRIALAGERDGAFDFAGGISCDLRFAQFSRFTKALSDGVSMPPMDAEGNALLAIKRDGDTTVVAAIRNYGRSDELALKIDLSAEEAHGLRLAAEHAVFFVSFIKGVTP